MGSSLKDNVIEALETLRNENEQLTKELALVKMAQTLTLKFIKQGSVAAADGLTFFSKLTEKAFDDLVALEKSSEFFNSINPNHIFGKLSDLPQYDDGTLDPLTKYLISDL